MLIPNHPDDERLSALASRDDDAMGDPALATHLAECARCATTVSELRSLRMALAGLPDLRPHRPLQLVPPVPDPEPVGGGAVGWIRRLFAPAMTAGAALALVGVLGTTMPAMSGADAGTAAGGGAMEAIEESVTAFRAESSDPELMAPGGSGPEDVTGQAAGEDTDGTALDAGDAGSTAAPGTTTDDGAELSLPAERSPWPMVLFTGVAIIVVTGLLRWILVPRAG